jgi:hypothetical protein
MGLLLVLTFVQVKMWRRIVAACVFAGMAGVSVHFSQLVHRQGWTGNPDFGGVAQIVLQTQRRTATQIVVDRGMSDLALPAGWVRDFPSESPLREIFDEEPLPRRQVQAVWHSPLTGFYRYDLVAQDFWYPGGPLKEGLTSLALRDRVEQP